MMCPLWPLHYFILWAMLWLAACQVVSCLSSWSTKITPEKVDLTMGQTSQVDFTLYNLNPEILQHSTLQILTEDKGIASVDGGGEYILKEYDIIGSNWSSAFNLSGNFLGYTSVKFRMKDNHLKNTSATEEVQPDEKEVGKVTVVRGNSTLDRMFTTSVIILVSIIFINFGCALDVPLLKRAITRPIGPAIGLVAHFLLLPVISFLLGLLLFPDSKALRLGLFFTGISPAGGASNIWTYTLGGNLNLSVTMTTVSTIASLALIPLWAFTLGQVILSGSGQGHIVVPHHKIATSAIGLLIPLAIGYLIQVYCKRLAAVMIRILKPFSSLLIVFIIIFAIFTNLYLFQLFTWEIIVAGIGLPWIGYVLGWVLATLCRQPTQDVLAIAVETGVQNTGVAIFLLRFSLGQPAADLTTVAPVAVALMTPIPLLILYLVLRCTGRLAEPTKVSSPPHVPLDQSQNSSAAILTSVKVGYYRSTVKIAP